MKKRTGTVKLAELCVISGGNDGNGCARRIIAMVSPSKADEPDDLASRALSTPPVRLTVKLSIATPCSPAAFAPDGYCL